MNYFISGRGDYSVPCRGWPTCFAHVRGRQEKTHLSRERQRMGRNKSMEGGQFFRRSHDIG